jgi:pimeloyl-ACP methyl ester carboxylesterase
MGAEITAKLLTTHPDRFLTATLGGDSQVRNWTMEREKAAEAAAFQLEHGTFFQSQVLSLVPKDGRKPSEEEIQRRAQELLGDNDPEALAALTRSYGELAVTDAQMASVRVPTLGIVGSADPSLADMNQLKAIMPSLKVVIINGATHGAERGALRRPEFVAAVREFIAVHRQR